ncbi:transglutaminase N-terminal domain-containing protein [Anatilimnocola sp. NA78]|uniref:transglutaminase family protein n=1 Tax=Anatilimnocola sp. NA78 TaxID=3415683 RepID=UPI003CE4962A
MSRLRIEHDTIYSYRRPVSFGRHRLVLRPREGHDLRVESMSLQIFPAHRLVWSRDVYSNSVAIVDFLEEAERLEVRSNIIVDRTDKFPREDPHEPWPIPWPVEYDERELPITAGYQLVSYPGDQSDVRAWMHQHDCLTKPVDAEAMLMCLCTLINSQIKYQRRMVKGVQSPSQTLTIRSGSCRDMAVLMMDAARLLGLAARFASGYLDCPAAEAGRAAMHAWTEVYLPVLGWRGFDPTIGEPCSLKHIVVGVSHHPRGVMPISGMFSGDSADYIEMHAPVKLERLG